MTDDAEAPLERTLSLCGLEKLEKGYSLSWSGLTYKVQPRGKEEKTILTNVFGNCQPGQMMAIMGPSGCGKTTLLDLLADRVSTGKTEGSILLGGAPRKAASARKIVSYVAQEDALLTAFTTRETLQYAAWLSLSCLSREKRDRRVTQVIEQMGLQACADTRVGDPLIKGLSGGQKRRLSIAIELLRAPPVLLLDEPTSGLDSTAALSVVEHLGSVASKGHAVVMSIHQASSKAYGRFDSLYLLSAGRQVYFGPGGSAPVEFFAKQGLECPQFSNPADFFLDAISTDFKGASGDKVEQLSKAYQASKLAASLSAQPQQGDGISGCEIQGAAGPAKQFLVLLHRMLAMNWKNPYIFGVRLVMYVALSFMVGTMYWDVGEKARSADASEENQRAALSLLPLLFYVQAFLVFMSVAILPFFLEQREVFRRERANGQITCLPYVLADLLAGLPGVALIAVISSLLVVYLAGLNGFEQFLANLLLSLIAAEALMHVIGAAQPHYIIGMAFGAGLFGMFMLCEGFMVPFSAIPDGWLWGHYIAFHTYSFAWFMHNQFSGEDGGFYGAAILKEYNMDDVDPATNACILAGYAVFFEVAFFFVLYIFHSGRR